MKRLALIPLLASAALAQRDLKEIPNTDPAAEMATFQLSAGLEVNLFASEPMIHKPIQMAWDEKGRLWVASSAIYPHIKPGQDQTDQILILEDTDHDGKADKSTVFYEGLLVPTGILPGDGGAYVANSTELLFMKEGPDGRAASREVLLSGFGTEDTHHILHGFKRGPDGCLYLMQSVYIHAHIETPFGVRRLSGSGIWQYRRETGRLEVFAMGHVNPWGHSFDKWGQSFVTDGAYGEGINYTFPGATFFCLPNQRPRILKGLNPGQPKQAGLEVISGRHFPDDWQGDMITNDFRGHRVNRFKVSDQGSGYASRQMEDVLRSTHGSFRPVDVKLGPDGALYIADWYNPIIQHGEVDFRDERRDHVHGRIWRVSVKGREKCPQVDYAKKSVEELIALLKEPEQWVRLEAKQALRTRNHDEVFTALKKAFAENKSDGAMLREITWAVQSAAEFDLKWPFDVELLQTLLAGTADMKAVATRVLGVVLRDARGEAAFGMTAPLATEPAARVRLEAINALRMSAKPQAVEAACRALDHPMDENLDFALWLTCSELADVWLPAFQKGEITFGGNVAHIAYALKAANKPEAVGALLTMVSEGKVTGDRVKDVIAIVGALGTKGDLEKLVELRSKVDNNLIAAALLSAAKQRNIRIDSHQVRFIANVNNDVVTPVVLRLIGAYQLKHERVMLGHYSRDNHPELSPAAMDALVEIGDAESLAILHEGLGKATDAGAKSNFLAALSKMNPAQSAASSAEFLGSLTDPTPAAKLFDAFLAQKNGPAILAAALKDRKIPAAIATAGVQRASATGGDTKALVEALTIAGGLQPVMALTPEQLTQMMAEVKSSGDPARGEAIYRRAHLQCQVCHAIGAVGGIVGPDMVSLGASAPVDYIIESLLEPSKKIKEGYATVMVSTKDGGIHSGFLVREDEREVLLRDATGKTDSIPAASVAKKESIPVSLMPPGLTASLRRDEFVDLVRFLSELGKEGGYKIQEDGTLRRWRTAQSPPEPWRWMSLNGNKGFHEKAADLTWLPLHSRVDGTVHGGDALLIQTGAQEWRAIESEIEVSAAGRIGLKVNDPAGLQLFVAGRELPASAEMQTDVPAGKVRITLIFDTAVRMAPVSVQVYDLPGSPSKSKAVRGI